MKKYLENCPIPEEFGSFNYRIKKQTSCPGLYAHVMGRLEPCQESFIFENRVMGGEIPREFIPACERGFREAMGFGPLAGYPVTGVKVILTGGSYHEVDSRALAFRLAARQAFYQGFLRANPVILEPIMFAIVQTPAQFFNQIIRDLLSHRGLIQSVDWAINSTVIRAEVPLSQVLGYTERLRSLSNGQASFVMESLGHKPVPNFVQKQLIENAAN